MKRRDAGKKIRSDTNLLKTPNEPNQTETKEKKLLEFFFSLRRRCRCLFSRYFTAATRRHPIAFQKKKAS